VSDPYGPLELSPDERWITYQHDGHRRRVGFHDYAAIYAVPGLYERVFVQELGMASTREVVAAYGRALAATGRDPAAERVLDLGAGNGRGGALLTELGVPYVVGTDLEPAAATAAERDHPGAYRAYEVGDLLDGPGALVDRLRPHGFTATLALSAIGVGHIPPKGLHRALGLLGPGGLFGFAVTPALLPESTDPAGVETGYPEFLAGLLERSTVLERLEYRHRVSADGTPHDAVAIVGRLPG
jgi:SAM-dependent methyltransferase